MRRSWPIWAVLILVLGTGFTSPSVFAAHVEADACIRLHVIANSDTEADQAVKHRVRDAILSRYGDAFAAGHDPEDAERIVEENLAAINALAEATLASSGMPYGASSQYGIFSFPTRQYGGCILPAGRYRALKVILGDGAGANWWCVLFPPLCVNDTSAHDKGETADAQEAEPPEKPEEGKTSRPRIKFKLLEWIQDLFD